MSMIWGDHPASEDYAMPDEREPADTCPYSEAEIQRSQANLERLFGFSEKDFEIPDMPDFLRRAK